MFFKAASWSIAFIFLAKGASKLFFWNELITNIYLLALNLIGYKFWGLTGLGISFLIAYILYLLQVFVVAKIKFEFTFTFALYKIFCFQLLLAIVCFLSVKLFRSPNSYFIGSLLIIISIWHAYNELNKRLGIKSIVVKIKNRF